MRSVHNAAHRVLYRATLIGTLLLAVCSARADTETWDFDLETSGEDVFYTSPTAVNNNAPLYDAGYEVTLVEIVVSYWGIEFGPFDITNEIPPEQLSGSGTCQGPPPFVVADQHIRYPDPPDPVTVEADMLIEIDADGYGHLSVTNVVLGTVVYDLGWPWGEVEVQLESVRVVGIVWITPVLPGDIDGDDDVDLADLALLLTSYGACDGDPEYNPDADLDGSGCVDLADLAVLLTYYGTAL